VLPHRRFIFGCCPVIISRNDFVFQHETIAGYRAYIHGIVGFFVVEDHVLNTGNGLVNRTYLDEVWSMALSKIVNALRTHSVCNTISYSPLLCEVLICKPFFSQYCEKYAKVCLLQAIQDLAEK
jgi:hypothetical protein